MTYLYFALAAFIGGIVQGTTGFGAGVISMLVLPYLLSLPEAAGVSGAMAIWICGAIAYKHRKDIVWSNIWLTFTCYVASSLLAIRLAPMIDTVNLKLAFGVFLLVLAAYFLVVKDGLTLQPTPTTKILVGVVSGLSDGFFGIGGPLMVILYMAFSKTREEYLGTLQATFTLVCVVNLIFRIQQGIMQAHHLPYVLLGALAMILALKIANGLNQKLNPELIKKATYVLIGFSGLMTLITTLASR